MISTDVSFWFATSFLSSAGVIVKSLAYTFPAGDIDSKKQKSVMSCSGIVLNETRALI